jgi:hypothetical protein
VYDHPINAAAAKLGVGVTVLKKYCRRFSIARWPYRKRQSLAKLIECVQKHCRDQPQARRVVEELRWVWRGGGGGGGRW